MMNTGATAEEFNNMIKNAATALKCNEQCVLGCTQVYWDLEEKAECLSQCRCYSPKPQFPAPAALY